MRRPINWFVFCLSLGFLFANLSFGDKQLPPLSQVIPATEQLRFSNVTVGEPAPTQFGYVRADGSFLPLAQQSAQTDVDASKVPARF